MYRPRGASSTLLSIVAERARYEYETGDGRVTDDDGPATDNASSD